MEALILLQLPIEALQESKDYAATIQDKEAFKLLRRVIMVKLALSGGDKQCVKH